jgi:hypothetical protein
MDLLIVLAILVAIAAIVLSAFIAYATLLRLLRDRGR